MKYVKKPIVVEAFRLGYDDKPEWFVDYEFQFARDAYIIIETLEGEMRGFMGDMIIKGIKGEIYPCKKDIFDATYDVCDEELESTVL
jgi:hypothetical protein